MIRLLRTGLLSALNASSEREKINAENRINLLIRGRLKTIDINDCAHGITRLDLGCGNTRNSI